MTFFGCANCTSHQLMTVNSGVINGDCSNLKEGMTVCLATSKEKDCLMTQVVKADDTCEKIAIENRVDLPILRENNQLDEECHIQAEQVRVFCFPILSYFWLLCPCCGLRDLESDTKY